MLDNYDIANTVGEAFQLEPSLKIVATVAAVAFEECTNMYPTRNDHLHTLNWLRQSEV